MNKIVEGLKDAVRSASCDHDWIVKDIIKMPNGYTRVKSRCDHCRMVMIRFLEPGAVDSVTVERTK